MQLGTEWEQQGLCLADFVVKDQLALKAFRGVIKLAGFFKAAFQAAQYRQQSGAVAFTQLHARQVQQLANLPQPGPLQAGVEVNRQTQSAKGQAAQHFPAAFKGQRARIHLSQQAGGQRRGANAAAKLVAKLLKIVMQAGQQGLVATVETLHGGKLNQQAARGARLKGPARS